MADENLKIQITAVDKTKQAFNSVSNQIKGLKAGALAIGGAVAAIGAGFVVAAKKTLDFADNLAKTADKIGVSTDALQELRVASDLLGVSQEQLESALGGLSKRLGELRAGTGSLKTFLDRTDPAFAQQLKSVTDNEEAFRLIIGRLEGYTNAQDRASLSAASFGRTAGLVFSNIRIADLDAGIERARQLGLVIEEDLLRNAEKIKDEFTLAAEVIRVQFMSQMLTMMRDMNFKQIASDLIEIAVNAMAATREVAKFFGLISRPASERISKLRAELDDLMQQQERNAEAGMNALQFGDPASLNISRTRAQELSKEIGEVSRQLEELQKKAKGEPLRVTIPAPKETKPTFDPLAELTKLADLRKATDQFGKTVAETKTPLQELAEASTSAFDAMQKGAVKAMDGIDDAFAGLITGTKGASDSFKSMADSIIADMLRMASRTFITGPLSSILNNVLGSAFSTSFDPMSYNLPGFAAGGVTSPNRAYVVGEKGPELFVPGMTGRVVPNGAGGGGQVMVNVYNNTGAQTRTEESTGPNGSKSIDIYIDEAVARNISSPGSRTGRALRNNFAGLNPQLAGR